MHGLVGFLFLISGALYAQNIEFKGVVQKEGSFNIKDYKEVNLVSVDDDKKHQVIKGAVEKTLKLLDVKVNPKSKVLVSIHVREEVLPNGEGEFDIVPLITINAIDLENPSKRYKGIYKILKTSDRGAHKFHGILGAQELLLGDKAKKPLVQTIVYEKQVVRQLANYYRNK